MYSSLSLILIALFAFSLLNFKVIFIPPECIVNNKNIIRYIIGVTVHTLAIPTQVQVLAIGLGKTAEDDPSNKGSEIPGRCPGLWRWTSLALVIVAILLVNR